MRQAIVLLLAALLVAPVLLAVPALIALRRARRAAAGRDSDQSPG